MLPYSDEEMLEILVEARPLVEGISDVTKEAFIGMYHKLNKDIRAMISRVVSISDKNMERLKGNGKVGTVLKRMCQMGEQTKDVWAELEDVIDGVLQKIKKGKELVNADGFWEAVMVAWDRQETNYVLKAEEVRDMCYNLIRYIFTNTDYYKTHKRR